MNPYTAMLGELMLTVDSNQPKYAALFVLLKVLEDSYSSGFDGSVTPAAYMIAQLKTLCGQLSPYVRELEQHFHTLGIMYKR